MRVALAQPAPLGQALGHGGRGGALGALRPGGALVGDGVGPALDRDARGARRPAGLGQGERRVGAEADAGVPAVARQDPQRPRHGAGRGQAEQQAHLAGVAHLHPAVLGRPQGAEPGIGHLALLPKICHLPLHAALPRWQHSGQIGGKLEAL